MLLGTSPGLRGVLKSGGLLAGSAFTLDIAGVEGIFRLLEEWALLEPTRGVLGTSPSSLDII